MGSAEPGGITKVRHASSFIRSGPSEARAPTVKQYELRWANLPAPIGRRPVLLLTRSPAYAYLNKVIVCEITSTVRGIPQEVVVGKREGLARASVANFDNVHVITTASLGERIGAVATHREREVKRALGHALGWAELKVL